MPEESKIIEAPAEEVPAAEDDHSGAEDDAENVADLAQPGEGDKKKKKKNKKSKGKKAATANDGEASASAEAASKEKMSPGMVKQLLKNNPSLATETQGMDPKKVQEMLGGLSLQQLLTGMVRSCYLEVGN